MGQKLVVRPISKGLVNDNLAFNIDNDSFPVIINAYQWRGRVKRKRGTSRLGILNRQVSVSTSLSGGQTTLANFPIVPGSINIVGSDDGTTYTDPTMNGSLTATGGTGVGGTINYATGVLNITAGGAEPITGTYSYYPLLPVMGLEDLFLASNQFPGTLAFDTTYSYNIKTVAPYLIYDVSFYKNPGSATYPSYIQKSPDTATTWNGATYQQFWTVNYQGALWATNGIDSGITLTTIGMQFNAVTFVSAITTTTAQFTIPSHGLVVGDFLFFNEFDNTIFGGLNFQTGYVTTEVDDSNIVVTFPNANLSGPGGSTEVTQGIAQYLTNRSNPNIDCLRWYDGDPTTTNNGWVNFAPPLSENPYIIDDNPQKTYYLVGARMIVPFKDRLLFLGPVIQTSGGTKVYLEDVVIYSQNGTPYYTCSYTNSPDATKDTPTNPPAVPPGLLSLLVPTNQTATPYSFFEDQLGFGGFVAAGVAQQITTVSSNEDALILGFNNSLQVRMIYSGNDLVPFNFYIINAEFGSASTFSTINMDYGVLTYGNRGFIITNQVEAKRIDLQIPDQAFQVNLKNNGYERFCATRDFINEWVYFTYLANNKYDNIYLYPNQTLQFNYRDNSWAIFNESYTTYGQFRRSTGLTWSALTDFTWSGWTAPWNSGTSTLLQPEVIAGNQQGFVLIRDTTGTYEAPSLYIESFSVNTITCQDHCLSEGNYLLISGCLGTIGTIVNGNIYSVMMVTENTFQLNPPIDATGATYLGSGTITRMYVPFIQTKQFPVAWDIAKKTRMGPQQYLLSTTPKGQISLWIYLSQNAASPYNDPTQNVNSGLIYSTVLYTCPESTNLGLTPANSNLQMIVDVTEGVSQQAQIWHRINTSLIGDTVQLAFTMNDSQMRDINMNNQFEEIELHGFILDVSPSQVLA